MLAGFFHFCQHPSEPFAELERSLLARRQQDAPLSGALIILPEAFNLGRTYIPESWNPAVDSLPPKFDEFTTLTRLTELSQQYSVGFVAGILDSFRNTAYLVDGTGPHLISRKSSMDGSGLYSPSAEVPKVSRFRDAAIAALICNDALAHDRREALTSELVAASGTPKIMCIPAHLRRAGSLRHSTADSEFGKVKYWEGCYAILANSRAGGEFSFIAGKDGLALEHTNCDRNTLRVSELH